MMDNKNIYKNSKIFGIKIIAKSGESEGMV